jgi:hypothetical protein
VDERLRAALRGDLPPPGSAAIESALSPREIQARLRAGATPEQVARAAGVPVVRVLRYAGPVLSERARVLEEAQAALMNRPRRGQSTVPLGDAVTAHLAATSGLRPETVEWSTFRRADGQWILTLRFVARNRNRRAQWLWDPHAHHVTSMDPLAGSLGFVAEGVPARRRSRPAQKPAKQVARKSASSKPAAKASRKSTTKKTAKRPVAKKPAAKRPVATKSAAKASSRRQPTIRKVTSQQAKRRTSVPSWSDVLLGGARPAPGRSRRRA